MEIPVTVNDTIEDGLTSRPHRQLAHGPLGELTRNRDTIVGCFQKSLHALDLL